jgi:hypothetical protein
LENRNLGVFLGFRLVLRASSKACHCRSVGSKVTSYMSGPGPADMRLLWGAYRNNSSEDWKTQIQVHPSQDELAMIVPKPRPSDMSMATLGFSLLWQFVFPRRSVQVRRRGSVCKWHMIFGRRVSAYLR